MFAAEDETLLDGWDAFFFFYALLYAGDLGGGQGLVVWVRLFCIGLVIGVSQRRKKPPIGIYGSVCVGDGVRRCVPYLVVGLDVELDLLACEGADSRWWN